MPDEYETKLLWTGIAASNKGKFLWKIELEDAGLAAPVARLPFPDEDVDTRRFAQLKKTKENKQQKKDGDPS